WGHLRSSGLTAGAFWLPSALQKAFQYLLILFGFLVRGHVAAFLEKYQLRPRYGVGHAPRGERRDIHVVAARDDQGREAKSRQLCGEIEILGGLLNLTSDRRP